jgi:hypothetical protein
VKPVRDLTLLIASTLALHLPFIGQAFHLDDVQYLEVAQNVYRNPFFPLELPVAFEGLHLGIIGTDTEFDNGTVVVSVKEYLVGGPN